MGMREFVGDDIADERFGPASERPFENDAATSAVTRRHPDRHIKVDPRRRLVVAQRKAGIADQIVANCPRKRCNDVSYVLMQGCVELESG